MQAPARPAALTALRHASAASHEELESLLRLDADVALARYRRILIGFDRFLAAWEPAMQAALPEGRRAWFIARSRRRFLADDFDALGLQAVPADREPVPLPALGSVAACFGSLYVIEGSALGGQVIARRLAARFGGASGRGAAYFHGWGDDTGGMWREFRELLDAELGTDPTHVAAACTAAVQTFDALGRVFQAELDATDTCAA